MVSKLLKLFCHIILLILVSCAKETKDNRKINDLPIYLKSKETPSNENLNFTRGKIIDLWTDKNILPQDFFEAFLVNDKAQAKHLCKLEKFSDSLNIALINSNLYYIHENILYAYDINHCKLLFSRKLEDKEYKIKSVIGFSFDNANIYVTTGARTLYNIDQKNGEIKWVVKLPNFLRSKPIYNNDYVYVIAVDDSIYKINANDGSLIWVDNYSIMHDKIVKDASITIEDNIIFHISSLGELIAKDLTTSDEILRRSIVKKENSNYFDTSLYSYIYSDYRYEY